MKRKKLLFGWVVVGSLTVSASLWPIVGCGKRRASGSPSNRAVPYSILYDQLGFYIRIKVPSDVDEAQLRATLAEVAEKHRDDPARDYLVREHLLVEAYLEKEGKLSTVPAGMIKRYVPPRNPEAKKYTREEADVFTIRLDEARRSLR